jgi:hypothetical protein
VISGSAYLVAKIFQFIKEQYKLEFRISPEILEEWQLTPYLPGYGISTAASVHYSNAN